MFGAAVRRDGTPSPALRRRIAFAAGAAAQDPQALLFCSGAKGRFGPSEARVMADMLSASVAPERLYRDEASVDTLQTVAAATDFARARGIDQCIACTDRYHQPRVVMLFALFGMRATPILFPRTETPGNRPWLRMHLREAAAIPYDLVAGGWAAWRIRRSRRRPR
ncbi:YdcF family protein [Sphingomonas sp. CROZ-RG-20F-R02-07]|uniref:YdcF family protein n=1 Tax=Sphingomonas sp. CROZ-RG-20F-R02-07 TaxID=2914832 RepID=UPI001F5A7602